VGFVEAFAADLDGGGHWWGLENFSGEPFEGRPQVFLVWHGGI
jgi:hypothetical protein